MCISFNWIRQMEMYLLKHDQLLTGWCKNGINQLVLPWCYPYSMPFVNKHNKDCFPFIINGPRICLPWPNDQAQYSSGQLWCHGSCCVQCSCHFGSHHLHWARGQLYLWGHTEGSPADMDTLWYFSIEPLTFFILFIYILFHHCLTHASF